MRFQHHINETSPDEWATLHRTLEQDCMPYIKELKGCKSLLRRGSKNMIAFFDKKTQRQDRRPLLVDQDIHELMDDWTAKNWGFRARSQSAFTTPKESNARAYGHPYIFFPIGKFKYAWNDYVNNLYSVYDTWWQHKYSDREEGETEQQISQRNFDDMVVPHLQAYKVNTGLNKLLKQSGETQGFSECIVNCKSYYLINPKWRTTLYAWYGDRYWRSK